MDELCDHSLCVYSGFSSKHIGYPPMNMLQIFKQCVLVFPIGVLTPFSMTLSFFFFLVASELRLQCVSIYTQLDSCRVIATYLGNRFCNVSVCRGGGIIHFVPPASCDCCYAFYECCCNLESAANREYLTSSPHSSNSGISRTLKASCEACCAPQRLI